MAGSKNGNGIFKIRECKGPVLGSLHRPSLINYREDIMQSWWCTSITSALRRQRHKDHCRFEASQGCIASLSRKRKGVRVQSAGENVQNLLTIFAEDPNQLLTHTQVAYNHL